MSLTNQIARNTIIQTFGKIGGTILGLLSISLITRYLGQTGFGQYTTVMTFLQFFGILVDFGLTLVTVQMISKPDADQNKILSNLFTLRLFSAALFLGLAPIAILGFPYEPVIKAGVAVTAISFLFISLNQVVTGVFQKNLKMGIVALAEILNRAVLLALIWLIINKNLGLISMLLAISLSNAVQFFILYTTALKFARIKLAFDWPIWKEIFHLSWPMAISITFNLVYLKTDTLLLSLFKTQAEVGIYGATYKVLEVLITLPIMFAGLVLPILTSAWTSDREKFQRVFQKAFDTLLLLTIPLVVGTWLTSKEVMMLVAGKDFADSGPVLNILILATAIIFIGSLFGHAIVAINRQKQTIWAYGLSALVSLIGYLIFIPIYSYFGAAWMTVASEAIVTSGIIWVFYRATGLIPQLNKLFISCGASLIMALAVLGAKAWLITPFFALNVIILVGIGTLTYALILILSQTLSLRQIKEIVKPV